MIIDLIVFQSSNHHAVKHGNSLSSYLLFIRPVAKTNRELCLKAVLKINITFEKL